MRGFEATAGLIRRQVQTVSEGRGFAVSRLLTHWSEIVGEAVASVARPIGVGYGRQGFGATLTLLTNGSNAPMLEMQREQIRDRVNACYGYNAITRVRVTQTAPTGFAEGRVVFRAKPAAKTVKTVSDPIRTRAAELAGSVEDGALRHALEALGRNVLCRSNNS
ncbi:MAG: DciA family protein [Pseudomonadota bacterium]